MSNKSVIGFTLLSTAILMAAGCTNPRGKDSATAGTDPWQVYPESIEGDMALSGDRFEETHAPVSDVMFEPVLFGFDSFQVPAGGRAAVEAVAAYLKSNPDLVLVVEGHCDERGSREYNLSLGEQRALAVRAYLVNLGIAPGRVQTVSYGKERPVDPGHNEAAWRLNRRAEFVCYR